MAKKTSNKELKPEVVEREEAVEVKLPKGKRVDIILLKDNKSYSVGRENAEILIKSKRAKLK